MLGIIVVNYKTIDRTSQYVREELAKIKTPHTIVIVNNACTDEHNTRLARACGAVLVADGDKIDNNAHIFILGAKDNLGYAKGNNLGVEFLTKHFDIEYLLFSNNDIIYKDDDVVERLISKLAQINDAGIIGPSVLDVEGNKMNPFVKPSIWRTHIIPNFFLPFFILMKTDVLSAAHLDREAQDGYCYRLSGSFMLTKADIFMKSGMFDPATFLYCEEPILSERYLRLGVKALYMGEVSVIHEHGYTSKQTHQPPQTQRLDFDSQMYYYEKYRSVSRIVIGLAKLSFSVSNCVWYPIINLLIKLRAMIRGAA